MKHPIKLLSPTDGNELEYVGVETHDGRIKLTEPKVVYKYTKSLTKLGDEVRWTNTQLQKLLQSGILIEF